MKLNYIEKLSSDQSSQLFLEVSAWKIYTNVNCQIAVSDSVLARVQSLLPSVAPSSTPRPRCVTSQLVSFPPAEILNSSCSIGNICFIM